MKRYRKMLASVALTAALTLGLGSTAFAYQGPATVATDDLNLREGGSLDYNVIDCLPRGAKVTVNFDAGYGWYQVTYNGQTGYIAGYYLLLGDTGPEETPETAETPAEQPAQTVETVQVPETAQVADPVQELHEPQVVRNLQTADPAATGSGNGNILGNEVRMRSGPSMNSETIAFLYSGNMVNVHGACGKWYEVDYNGSVGYIYGDYVLMNGQNVTYTMTVATTVDDAAIYTEPVTEDTYVAPVTVTAEVQETPAQAETPAETPAEVKVESSINHNAAAGQTIVDSAMQYLGVPYVWGGESLEEGGFDCSGLVYAAYGENGIKLNRVAQAMYHNGVAVDLNDLQAGDILLFGSSVYNIWHAALYVGDGMYIHAPYSGAVVRTQYLNETYGMNLVAARRLV